MVGQIKRFKRSQVEDESVYILTDKHYELGSIITMTIDLDSPPGTRVSCVGTIVRVEHHGARVGVTVRMKPGETKILDIGPPEKI